MNLHCNYRTAVLFFSNLFAVLRFWLMKMPRMGRRIVFTIPASFLPFQIEALGDAGVYGFTEQKVGVMSWLVSR